jgi:uncharacterized membrane protein
MTTAQLIRPFGSGAVAGLRSMTGPATALRGSKWQRALPLIALSEFIVDKLPNVPSRTILPSLCVRLASGAISGAVTSKRSGGSRWLGAVLGGAGALGATYLGAAYRKAAAERNVPPVVAALIEDAVAVALGIAAARSFEK